MAQGECVFQMWTRSFGIARPKQGTAGHRAPAKFKRNGRQVRGDTQINVPFQVVWGFSHEIPPEFKKGTNAGFSSQSFSQHHRSQRMKLDFEFRHYAEVAAASTQGPE